MNRRMKLIVVLFVLMWVLPVQAQLTVEERIQLSLASGGVALDLAGFNLTEIPAALFQMPGLRELNLTNNQLTSLPENFGQLTSLKKLYLNNNPLQSLPESFGQLNRL